MRKGNSAWRKPAAMHIGQGGWSQRKAPFVGSPVPEMARLMRSTTAKRRVAMEKMRAVMMAPPSAPFFQRPSSAWRRGAMPSVQAVSFPPSHPNHCKHSSLPSPRFEHTTAPSQRSKAIFSEDHFPLAMAAIESATATTATAVLTRATRYISTHRGRLLGGGVLIVCGSGGVCHCEVCV